jgi:hypothetical protein
VRVFGFFFCITRSDKSEGRVWNLFRQWLLIKKSHYLILNVFGNICILPPDDTSFESGYPTTESLFCIWRRQSHYQLCNVRVAYSFTRSHLGALTFVGCFENNPEHSPQLDQTQKTNRGLFVFAGVPFPVECHVPGINGYAAIYVCAKLCVKCILHRRCWLFCSG